MNKSIHPCHNPEVLDSEGRLTDSRRVSFFWLLCSFLYLVTDYRSVVSCHCLFVPITLVNASLLKIALSCF